MTQAEAGSEHGDIRDRLERERAALVDELRRLGVSVDTEPASPARVAGTVLDIGDQAQVSERANVAVATRERLAARVNRLTAALERLARGGYGTCGRCGRVIERERLRAVPEAELCRQCQAEVERRGGAERLGRSA